MDGKSYSYVDNGKVKTLKPRGHYMLVRRHKTSVDRFLVDGEFMSTPMPFDADRTDADREAFVESVVDSFAKQLDNSMCEVLALGPDVGKPRSRKELKALRLVEYDGQSGRERIKDCIFVGKPGDTVALPENAASGRMFRGVTGQEFDLMVDEGELIGAYIPRESSE